MTDEPPLDDVIETLHDALEAVDAHPDPAVRQTLGRALDALRRIHAEGVRRLASLALTSDEAARVALSDPLVANLLHLYGVTDADRGASVVEVLGGGPRDDGDGSYRVRLDSGEAVSFVPESRLRRLAGVLRDAAAEPAARERPAGARWEVELPAELGPDDGLAGLLVHGYPVLFVRWGGRVRAYRNTCPGSLLPLHLGDLDEDRVRCPWHGCAFDPATGARDGGGDGLLPLQGGPAGGGRWEVVVP